MTSTGRSDESGYGLSAGGAGRGGADNTDDQPDRNVTGTEMAGLSTEQSSRQAQHAHQAHQSAKARITAASTVAVTNHHQDTGNDYHDIVSNLLLHGNENDSDDGMVLSFASNDPAMGIGSLQNAEGKSLQIPHENTAAGLDGHNVSNGDNSVNDNNIDLASRNMNTMSDLNTSILDVFEVPETIDLVMDDMTHSLCDTTSHRKRKAELIDNDEHKARARREEKEAEVEAKREVKVKQRIEFEDTIDHLMVAGGYQRHIDWRLRVHDKLRASIDQPAWANNIHGKNNTSKTISNDHHDDISRNVFNNNHFSFARLQKLCLTPWDRSATNKKNEVHVNDILVYGRNGRAGPSWPAQVGFRLYSDQMWQTHYGDWIDNVTLSKSRLTSEYIHNLEQVELLPMVDPEIDDTLKYKTARDVPSDMLEKCWHRAVHAASALTEVQVPVMPDCDLSVSLGSINVDSFNLSNAGDGARKATHTGQRDQHDNMYNADMASLEEPVTVEEAIKQCERLRVRLTTVSPFVCPSCTIELVSEAKLHEHFYGTDKCRGCCWRLLHAKKVRIRRRLLESEVVSQADQLMRHVLRSVQKDQKSRCKKKANTDGTREKKCDWEYVLNLMWQTAPESVESTGIADGVVLESRDPPLLINRMVLEAASRRLINRYTHAPK
jgi:hypothetical protein